MAIQAFVEISHPYTADAPPPIKAYLQAAVGVSSVTDITVATSTATDSLISTHCSLVGGCSVCKGNESTYKLRPPTYDYELFRAAVSAWDGTSAVLIAKATTIAPPGASTGSINTVLADLPADADVFYVAKWLDRADLWTTVKIYSDSGARLVQTVSPQGFQAVLFTAKGFSSISTKYAPDENPVACRPFAQLLSLLVSGGSVVAYTTTPSILSVDPLSSAIVGEPEFAYLKNCELRGQNHPERPFNRRVTADLTAFWAVLVIIIATAAVWLLMKTGLVLAS